MKKHEFTKELRKVHPQLLPLGSTSLKQETVECMCRDCGSVIHLPRETIFEKATCCPVCKYKRLNKKKIMERLSKLKLKLVKIVSETESMVSCECGNEFILKNEEILERKPKCKMCHNEAMQKRKEIFTELARDICLRNNLDFISISDNLKDITYLCNVCNEPQTMRLGNFLNATMFCRTCRNRKDRLSQAEYESKVRDRFEVLGEYKGMEHEIKVRCKKCGKELEDLAIRFAYVKKICCYKNKIKGEVVK